MSTDQFVLEFYNTLFEQLFTAPLANEIGNVYKSRSVKRQIEEAADAVSQSLARFFTSQQLQETDVQSILAGLSKLPELIQLENIANARETPESIFQSLMEKMPCSIEIEDSPMAAVYRVALQIVVQVLVQVGPLVAEWRRLNFSGEFELLRQVTFRLNQISQQLHALGDAGRQAAGASQESIDEHYELIYRDFLMQRFFRIESGTVRMTTNLDVDIRDLFVPPRLLLRPAPKNIHQAQHRPDTLELLNLASARAVFSVDEDDFTGTRRTSHVEDKSKPKKTISALAQVKKRARNVLVGLPGSGKSTFLEWLQLQIASGEEELLLNGKQAIPVLIRVRHLDLHHLPEGRDLIENAIGSADKAKLMPEGWLDRQMKAGHVLFMIDGLDETEPQLLEDCLLPWLGNFCRRYNKCRFVISSRPVGYPPGLLAKWKFAECDLLDFDEDEIAAYTCHWCTAVRIARNEPRQEALREGKQEGQQIIESFKTHPYIRHLARNPLMLSAICLVNYYEGGELPKDRAMLYRLCVEGLLHHWDQRRGIHSEFALEEKLRVCREVALAMQADDRAEYEAAQVQEVFAEVLGDTNRAEQLLEHVRYRTGLLIERRAGVFGFAHLTFQEYLAAVAIQEGNRRNIDTKQLARNHHDGRWNEVIALYCGMAPAPAVRNMLNRLIRQPGTEQLGQIITEAYLTSGPEIANDGKLRSKVIEKVASSRGSSQYPLDRFDENEVLPIAHQCIGESDLHGMCNGYIWLYINHQCVDFSHLLKKLAYWRNKTALQIGELSKLLHGKGSNEVLKQLATLPGLYQLYESTGPTFHELYPYSTQASFALQSLCIRHALDSEEPVLNDTYPLLLEILRVYSQRDWEDPFPLSTPQWLTALAAEITKQLPPDPLTWQEFALLSRDFAQHLSNARDASEYTKSVKLLYDWADKIEQALASQSDPPQKQKKPKAQMSPRRSERKPSQ
jgi:hypothetical protein